MYNGMIVFLICVVIFMIMIAICLLEEWWYGPFADWWDKWIRKHNKKG